MISSFNLTHKSLSSLLFNYSCELFQISSNLSVTLWHRDIKPKTVCALRGWNAQGWAGLVGDSKLDLPLWEWKKKNRGSQTFKLRLDSFPRQYFLHIFLWLSHSNATWVTNFSGGSSSHEMPYTERNLAMASANSTRLVFHLKNKTADPLSSHPLSHLPGTFAFCESVFLCDFFQWGWWCRLTS